MRTSAAVSRVATVTHLAVSTLEKKFRKRMPTPRPQGAAVPTTPSPRKRKRPSQTLAIESTSPVPSTPPQSTPRRRKPKQQDDETPSPEKRLKRYRDHPPQSVMVKHERVMTQRMFLVERSGRQNGALEEDFSVLGSTGNVYIVKVSMVPTYPSACCERS